jgi:[acyl-carrier-protein] S-malonyltransferase
VAGAFHSPLMASAAMKLDAVLAGVEFREPTVPVLSNVMGAPHEGARAIRTNMVRQVTDPVLWLSCVEWMAAQGVDRYVECGPGKVLTGLIKRIAAGATLQNVSDVASAMSVAGKS